MTAILAAALLLPATFLESWSVQECGVDMVCGLGARGERGPFQISPPVWHGRNCMGDPWDWRDSAQCAAGYLHNLAGRQMCDDQPVAWGLAAYNWGIGNVLDLQRREGCDLTGLPGRVYWYAVLGLEEPPGAF